MIQLALVSLVTFEFYIWQKRCPRRASGPVNAPDRIRVLRYVRLGKVRLS